MQTSSCRQTSPRTHFLWREGVTFWNLLRSKWTERATHCRALSSRTRLPLTRYRTKMGSNLRYRRKKASPQTISLRTIRWWSSPTSRLVAQILIHILSPTTLETSLSQTLLTKATPYCQNPAVCSRRGSSSPLTRCNTTKFSNLFRLTTNSWVWKLILKY